MGSRNSALASTNYLGTRSSRRLGTCGDLRGPFDLGLIPIGAYAPRFMYSAPHSSPYDAVEIFQDTKCRRALGIHWGTFSMTSEPVEEPPEKLKEVLKIKGLAQKGLFDVCAIGEGRDF